MQKPRKPPSRRGPEKNGPPPRPILWIVAGPNGSGKSSLYQNTRIDSFDGSVWIINPDLLTIRILNHEKCRLRDANLAAVKRIWKWLRSSIAAHQTVGVETVLSTGKYRKLVREAKKQGFEVRLIYVILDSPARNYARVQIRVKKGGHSVPRKKVFERYERSISQMPWFFYAADRAYLYDNSLATPKLMIQKEDGVIWVYPAALPVIRDVLQLEFA